MDFTKKPIKTNFLTPDEIQNSLDKGHKFENYVANLFKLKKIISKFLNGPQIIPIKEQE